MVTVRVLILLSLFGVGVVAGSAARAEDGERILSGELVITNAANNQFRLVGHNGSFTAPAGLGVDAFDGKAVRVELGRDGRVATITEQDIPLKPITHGYETVSGQLVVTGAAPRTFKLAGDDRVYLAPAGMDVQPYAGQKVDVRLDSQGQVTEITLAPHSGLGSPQSLCAYGGESYSAGTQLCQSGTQFRCDGGTWASLGVACASPPVAGAACNAGGMAFSDGAVRCDRGTQYSCAQGSWRSLGIACAADNTTASRQARSCIVGNATVANGSSICRSGTTQKCVDGDWVNTLVPCS